MSSKEIVYIVLVDFSNQLSVNEIILLKALRLLNSLLAYQIESTIYCLKAFIALNTSDEGFLEICFSLFPKPS